MSKFKNWLHHSSKEPSPESEPSKLFQSFEKVIAIDNPTKREKIIAQEAELFNLSLEHYSQQLQSYLDSHHKISVTDTLIKPVSSLDAKMSDFVTWLENISLIKLAAVMGEAALLFALLSYILAIPQRKQALIRENRQILIDQAEKYSTGRVEALKLLNKLCANISGLQAPQAQIPKISLNHCSKFHLSYSSFQQWPWQFSQFEGINLSYGNLEGANLIEANLEGANLTGINLAGANLRGANLKGVNLSHANLKGAILGVTNMEDAILHKAVLDGGVIAGANLKGADLSEASLINVRSEWVNLTQANLYRTNFQESNLNRGLLAGADLYKANLQNTSMRFVDLYDKANLRGAKLKGADLFGARFESVDQVQRAVNWQQAIKSPNWKNKIKIKTIPRLKIGLIKSSQGTIFKAYELGMRRAADRRVEIWGVQSSRGVENEAKTIRKLVESGIDAIVLRPEHPIHSKLALREANHAGVVIITIDFCFEEDEAIGMIFACYNTDSFQMGYDSGLYLAQWAKKNLANQEVNLGLVDSAKYDRYYPNLQGFLAAMEESDLSWNEVASTDAVLRADVPEVMKMLQDHPEINILWGGSNSATEIAVKAVQRLGLEDKVAVFGILDLSKKKINMLLDPNSPLQSVIDQSGVKIGYEAVKTATKLLRHQSEIKYTFYPVEHRLLTQDNHKIVQELLTEANSIR